MAAASSQNPRYEGHGESAPAHVSGTRCPVQPNGHGDPAGDAGDSGQRVGHGLTPTWCGWSSLPLVVVGVSTLVQVRGIGAIGAGAVLPMFTAAVSIPFCITAVTDGGPGDADHAGGGGGRGPACHLQVAVHTKADRDPDRGRHRDNDIVYHAGFRRI